MDVKGEGTKPLKIRGLGERRRRLRALEIKLGLFRQYISVLIHSQKLINIRTYF